MNNISMHRENLCNYVLKELTTESVYQEAGLTTHIWANTCQRFGLGQDSVTGTRLSEGGI